MDLWELVEENGGDMSKYKFLSSMVDTEASLDIIALAGFRVDIGLGLHLKGNDTTPFITGK